MSDRARRIVVETPLDDDLALPRPPGVVRRFWSRHPRAADIVSALVALLISLPAATVRADASYTPTTAEVWLAVALTILGGVALVFRRRIPILVVAVCGVPLVVLPFSLSPVAHVLLAFAVYAVAVYRSARACWTSTGIVVAVVAAHGLLLHALSGGVSPTLGDIVGNTLSVVLVLLIGALLGVNVGSRRRYLEALIDRSRQLAVERDQQARLAAAAERTRIAREMHDIVSHSLTVVVALSEGAIAATSADRARAASRIAADTARTALEDMRAMLGVLRDVDDDGSPLEPLEPVDPGETVAAAQRAGFPVTLTQRGDLAALPRSIRFALGRVVQESITNALRHAPAAASIRVELEAGTAQVRATIRNDGVLTAPVARAPGFGLRGLGERVELVGGTLHAGPDGAHAWRVEAVLPLPADDSEDRP